MADVSAKVAKQLAWQRDAFAQAGDRATLFVDVDHLTALIVAQLRSDTGRTRAQVKADLEGRADAGELHRWSDVHGPSQRPDRVDHYLLPVPGGR